MALWQPARKTNATEWFPHSFVNEVSILRCLPPPRMAWGDGYFFARLYARGCRISIAPFVCSSEGRGETEIRLFHVHTTRLKRWFPIFFLLFFYLTFQLLFRSISSALHFSALSIKGHNLWRNVIRPVSGMLYYSNVSQIPLSHPILKTVSIFASFPTGESLISLLNLNYLLVYAYNI